MIESNRITRSHLCSEDCKDPGAHFQGSDDDWQEFVQLVRERDHLRDRLRVIKELAIANARDIETSPHARFILSQVSLVNFRNIRDIAARALGEGPDERE